MKTGRSMRIAGMLLFAGQISLAVDFSGVPGEVLAYHALQYDWYSVTPRRFIADPELIVLPNGDYLAAHTLAGRSSASDTTWLFRSTDKGESWTALGSRTGMYRGSFFVHEGDVYLYGANKEENGNARVMKSSDNGESWTASALFSFSGPATPNNPLVFNGRIWSAHGRASVSAPVDSPDLLDPDAWRIRHGFPDGTNNPEWRSGGEFIGEGQIVASPEEGLVILPKVRSRASAGTSNPALSALGRVNAATGQVSFDPDNDFISLPGGEKKFGAAYDAESGKFLVLSNPILPAHFGSSIASAMMRNTMVLLTSRDLRNWKVERIILYSNDERREGFGYPNMDFDGEDLLIIARSSMKLPGETWPGNTRGGHDSNLLTFHRLADFRSTSPEHELRISGNQVLRFERTQHHDAPLGSFALGTVFDGSPLTAPVELGQDANGEVYILEDGGRILRFDATGNFLEIVGSAPVALQSSPLDVIQPADGTATWVIPGSGDWFDSANWYYWSRADTPSDVAVFGSALTSPGVITVDEPYTFGGLRILSAHQCTFSGAGRFTWHSGNGPVQLEIGQGSHEIQIPVSLESDAVCRIAEGAGLIMPAMSLGGNSLRIEGAGMLSMQEGVFALGGGSLILDGGTLDLDEAMVLFDGTVEFRAPEGFIPSAGDMFQILEGELQPGLFQEILLPPLREGLAWDTSVLDTEGTIAVIRRIPEWWLVEHGLPTDGSADFEDTDGDGFDNYSEWKAGTDPNDPDSFFQVQPAGLSGQGFTLRWHSLTGRTYRVERSTNLLASPPFVVIESGIPGQAGVTEFLDSDALEQDSVFYRAVVE